MRLSEQYYSIIEFIQDLVEIRVNTFKDRTVKKGYADSSLQLIKEDALLAKLKVYNNNTEGNPYYYNLYDKGILCDRTVKGTKIVVEITATVDVGFYIDTIAEGFTPLSTPIFTPILDSDYTLPILPRSKGLV